MIRFFKSLQPAALFLIPFIGLILWVGAYTKPLFLSDEKSGLLYPLIAAVVGVLPRFLQVLLAVGLITYEAIYLSLMLNRHEVLYKNTYGPGLLFVLLMSFSRDTVLFHPLLITNLLTIFILDKTFSLFKNDSPAPRIFDSCFLISITSMIYFPASLLFILFLFALTTLRTFSLREWIVAFIAVVLPYFFAAVYFFWTDSLGHFLNGLVDQFTFHNIFSKMTYPKSFLIFAVYCSLLMFLALSKLRLNFTKNTIKTRSFQQILFFYFFFSCIGFFLMPVFTLDRLTLLAVPASIFLAYYYISSKRKLWLFELSLWVLVAVVLYNHLW